MTRREFVRNTSAAAAAAALGRAAFAEEDVPPLKIGLAGGGGPSEELSKRGAEVFDILLREFLAHG